MSLDLTVRSQSSGLVRNSPTQLADFTTVCSSTGPDEFAVKKAASVKPTRQHRFHLRHSVRHSTEGTWSRNTSDGGRPLGVGSRVLSHDSRSAWSASSDSSGDTTCSSGGFWTSIAWQTRSKRVQALRCDRRRRETHVSTIDPEALRFQCCGQARRASAQRIDDQP